MCLWISGSHTKLSPIEQCHFLTTFKCLQPTDLYNLLTDCAHCSKSVQRRSPSQSSSAHSQRCIPGTVCRCNTESRNVTRTFPNDRKRPRDRNAKQTENTIGSIHLYISASFPSLSTRKVSERSVQFAREFKIVNVYFPKFFFQKLSSSVQRTLSVPGFRCYYPSSVGRPSPNSCFTPFEHGHTTLSFGFRLCLSASDESFPYRRLEHWKEFNTLLSLCSASVLWTSWHFSCFVVLNRCPRVNYQTYLRHYSIQTSFSTVASDNWIIN